MSRPPLFPQEDPIRSLAVVMLSVSDRCGGRCRMCDIWKPRGGGPNGRAAADLDLDLLVGWLPGWRALGVRRVGLTGGDPLVHEEIDRLLGSLGDAGFRLTLMTAGTGLVDHTPAVARRCDSVVVSLDGPPEVHDAIRRTPGSFAEMRSGIEAVRERAGEAIRITARCTVQDANVGHLVATVETARGMELDGISLLPVDASRTAFGRTGADSEESLRRRLCPAAGDLDTLAAELEAVADGAGSGGEPDFVAEDRRALRTRVLDHFRAEAGLIGHRARPCNAPWVSAVVEIDGTVRPCFFHEPSGRAGPLDDLGAVLNADPALEQRSRLDVANDPICRRCVCPLALRVGEAPE